MKTEAEDKKLKITKAAAELFFKNGYYNTSVEAIAKKAQCSKTTIYQLFKDKEDLIAEIAAVEVGVDMNKAMKHLSAADAPRERLLRFAEASLKSHTRKKSVDFYRLLISTVANSKIDTRSVAKGPVYSHRALCEFFEKIGLITPPGYNLDDAAEMFVSLVHGSLISAVNTGAKSCKVPAEEIKRHAELGVDAFFRIFSLPEA